MSHHIKDIEYKGFFIVLQRAMDGGIFYTIKSDTIQTSIYLTSEVAAKKVIDTYLKSLNK